MQKPLNPLVFCASLSTNTWGGSPLFLRGRGGTGVCRAEITSSRSGLDSSCVPPRPPHSVLQTGGFSHSLRQEDINYHQQRERERETTLSVNPHEEQQHESRQKPHLSIKHTCTDTHHTLYLHNLHEPDVSPLWLCSSSPVQQRGLCNRCFTLPQPGLESKDKIWMLIKRETYSRSMLDWITSSYQTHSTCYFMHQVSSKLLLDFRFSAPNTTSSSKLFSWTIQGDDLKTCHLQYAAVFTQYSSFEMFSHIFLCHTSFCVSQERLDDFRGLN